MSEDVEVSSGNPKRALDLFCGAGGLSLGFQLAGFEVVGGVDNDVKSMSTFHRNFSSSRAWVEDLAHPSPEFRDWLKNLTGTLDVLIGGPPCQGFSIAGKRDPNDPRNVLYKNFMSGVEITRPRYVLLENVPNIVKMNQGAVRDAIIEDLNELGYKVKVETLNASHFGVPQTRKRAFFVAYLNGNYNFPQPTTLNMPLTCADAIEDLPNLDNPIHDDSATYNVAPMNRYQKLMRSGSRKVQNHELVRHTEKTKEIISLVPDGGNYKDLPEALQSTRRVNIAWTRMNSQRPCFTIDAGHNHHFHYSQNRVPSVRESARIQSFPDTFVFEGTRTSQYRQVGNAVPPLLAMALASSILEGLEN